MGFSFGSFDYICEHAALVVCPLVGSSQGYQGIQPTCYSRNVDVGGTLIFQPSTSFIHIVAIIMTAIMILHVRSKYTAIGRKEILMFFYLYAVDEFLAMFLDSGIIPTESSAYPWFAAIYTGLVAATYCCLVVNGFVGFQFAEDGTPVSLWFERISCLVVFGVSFFVAIATFQQFAGFQFTKPTGVWVIYFLWPAICAVVYIISQLVLVLRTLEDRWPVGDILFGTAFFVAAVVILFGFSVTICNAVQHYIDGVFFFTLCILLCVMMVYKYWDSITKEDLEFSVGNKAAVWEVKDVPLLAHVDSGPDYDDDLSYHPTRGRRVSTYDKSTPSSFEGDPMAQPVQSYNQSRGRRSTAYGSTPSSNEGEPFYGGGQQQLRGRRTSGYNDRNAPPAFEEPQPMYSQPTARSRPSPSGGRYDRASPGSYESESTAYNPSAYNSQQPTRASGPRRSSGYGAQQQQPTYDEAPPPQQRGYLRKYPPGADR